MHEWAYVPAFGRTMASARRVPCAGAAERLALIGTGRVVGGGGGAASNSSSDSVRSMTSTSLPDERARLGVAAGLGTAACAAAFTSLALLERSTTKRASGWHSETEMENRIVTTAKQKGEYIVSGRTITRHRYVEVSPQHRTKSLYHVDVNGY